MPSSSALRSPTRFRTSRGWPNERSARVRAGPSSEDSTAIACWSCRTACAPLILSSQSGDHGVSIDPAGLARLEVVKGPATLLYGSNAVGGVVNAITPQDAFRSSPFAGTLGGVSFDTGSANEQAGFAGNVQHGRGLWMVHGSFTGRRTGDYDAPEVTIPNSATRLFTGEGGVGWTGARAYFGVSGGGENNRYGIPFAALLEGEEDAQIDVEVKRANVRFDGGMRNLAGGFADGFRVTAVYVDYQHDELEIADEIRVAGHAVQQRRSSHSEAKSSSAPAGAGTDGSASSF